MICSASTLHCWHASPDGSDDGRKPPSSLTEILVGRPSCTLPIAVIVQDQDAARRKARKKTRQFVLGRCIPIRIEAQHGDWADPACGQSFLDRPLYKMDQ